MNLLNLIGATLLAVSPIHEPKNVQIPSDTILQKVEYLDYNIISTSYILTDSDSFNNIYSYFINLSDSKDINVDLFYTITQVRSDSTVSCSIQVYDNIFDNEDSVEFTTTSQLLHDLYENSYVDDSYLKLTLNEDGEGALYLECEIDVPEIESNNLSFHNFVLTLDISEENTSYYTNFLHSSTDEGSLRILNIDLGSDNIFTYFLNKYLFTIESGPITDGIFDIVGNTVENYVTTITNLFSRVIALFYVDSKLTILGVLMVFTFGIGIVKFGFNLIKDLLRL